MLEIIWNLLLIICAALFIMFTFVVLVGAPFLPTLNKRVTDIFLLVDLKPGQTLLELGSGDGRVLEAAAKRGIKSIGYELNPLLVLYSKIKLWRYRKLVKVNWGNYWNAKLPKADAIFVFLLQPYMQKLDKKIIQDFPEGVKLVSFAFIIDKKKPSKELNGMYLYNYPNRLKKIKN